MKSKRPRFFRISITSFSRVFYHSDSKELYCKEDLKSFPLSIRFLIQYSIDSFLVDESKSTFQLRIHPNPVCITLKTPAPSYRTARLNHFKLTRLP
ncbi:MAG: hypothetical protein JWQ40_4888 [Segetibacter sp.]|jgi:hypothetical protein|nr:hypothetical protein [Segetibacter sp.]